MDKLFKFPESVLAFIVFILVTLVLFWQFFFKGMLPIPGDILIGIYFPWINHTWGYAVSPPVKNPLMSDIVSLMYPWRKVAIDYLKHGQLPLWDPTSFMGQSLIGNLQVAVFNPLNTLFLLPISFDLAWSWQVVLQPFLAMLATYYLFKKWQMSFIPAIAGAVSYGMSAPMLIWMEYNLLGFLIVLLPVALLCVDYFIRNQKPRALIALSIVVTLGVFSGYLQFLYYVLFFSYLYGVGLIFNQSKKSLGLFLKWTMLFISFTLLGLFMAAIQIVPGLESVGSSIRSLDNVAAGNGLVFLPFGHLLTAFVPDFFGNPATYNYFGAGSYESFILYTTIGFLPFVFWSFSNPKYQQFAWIMLGFVVLSLLMSLENPISHQIQQLTFLGLKGSVSSRVLFIFSFGISGLGVLGLQAILDKKPELFNLKSFIALAVMAGIVIGAVLNWGYVYKFGYATESADIKNLVITLRNLIWPLGVCFTSTLILLSLKKIPKLVFLIILLICLDMFRFGSKYLPFTPAGLIFPETKTTQFLKNQPLPSRIAIEKSELLTANTWSVYNLQSITGYNILLARESADYISLLNHGVVGKENSRFLDIQNFNSNLLDLANVEYVVGLLRKKGVPDPKGELPTNLKSDKLVQVEQDGPVVILKNTRSLKRYFIPENIKIIDDKKNTSQEITQNVFNPGNQVILEKNPGFENPGKCLVDLLSYNGQSFSFKTFCEDDSVLVVTESFHPGWQAFINGSKTEVDKSYGQFLAISLPEGKSIIKLDFFPQSVKYGFYLSLLGIIVAIFSWFYLPKLKMLLLNKNSS